MFKNKLLFSLSIIFIVIISFFLFYSFNVVESVQILRMDLRVSNSYGFNLDEDLLHLGKTVPGSDISRGFNMSNNRNYPVKVRIIKKGELSKWVFVNETEFVMQPYSQRVIMVTAYPPKDAKLGYYTGYLKIPVMKTNIT